MPVREAGPTSLLHASPRSGAGVLPGFAMAVRSAPSSVEVARRVTRAWGRHCRAPEPLLDILQLVVSELCTNAVVHSRCDSFGVCGWMPAPRHVHVEVRDGTPSRIPQPQCPDTEAEGGRGLFLVECLVAELGGDWGFTEDGTCAWCSFPFPEGEQ
ncbi:ATP-binding protein [Streptomyces fructofermentans]|uniref:ATP-binding protein n=1 Tax=Streptomyces fructofermentans TaxID=152141 RepID=UPI003799B769